MLTLKGFVLGVTCLSRLAAAAAAAADPLEKAPPCSAVCLSEALSQPTYSSQTQAQLCVNGGSNDLVRNSILYWIRSQGPDRRRSMPVVFVNAISKACGVPMADRRSEARATSLAMFVLAALFFACRVVFKAMGLARWGADDSLAIIAFISLLHHSDRILTREDSRSVTDFDQVALTAFVVGVQRMIPHGLGLDIWILHDYQITTFLKYLLIVQTLYAFTLSIIKASILALFLRIFPDSNFRVFVWLNLSYNLLVGVVFLVLGFIQRQPTWLIWDGWCDKEPRGIVVNLNKMGMLHGSINIALDVWMLLPPLTQLHKLNLRMKKKLVVIAMFAIGTFLAFVSTVQLRSMMYFATSMNATADACGTTIWSTIELCTGIVVACMPNARHLLCDTARRWRTASNKPQSRGFRSSRMLLERSLEIHVTLDSPVATSALDDSSEHKPVTALTSDGKNLDSIGNREMRAPQLNGIANVLLNTESQ